MGGSGGVVVVVVVTSRVTMEQNMWQQAMPTYVITRDLKIRRREKGTATSVGGRD